MRISIRLWVIWITLVLSACSSQLNPRDYILWVEDYENGLHLQKTAGKYTFDIQYKPAAYVLLQQEKINVHNKDTFQARLAEYEQMQYYTLTIQCTDGRSDFIKEGISTQVEQQQKLYYYSYLFQDDLYVEENGEKLPCVLFHFERSYDLKPSRTFVLGFEKRSNDQAPSELVIDSDWLPTGPLRVRIDKQNIPTIQI